MGTFASTRIHASRLGILLAMVAMGDLGLAQEQHLKVLGRGTWRLNAVDEIGDLDQDGVTDLVVGAVTGGIPGSGVHGGLVVVVSGRDGHWMRVHPGPHDYDFGYRVAGVGDVDGDGTPDYATGVTDDGPGSFDGDVWVWSGRSGALIRKIDSPAYVGQWRFFGWVLAPLGDLDQDGDAEFGAGWMAEGDIVVFSGPDAALLRVHRHFSGRPSLASIGDVDLDGSPDYVLGRWAGPGYPPYTGYAELISGMTGQVLFQVGDDFNTPYWEDFGRSVAAAGDHDGDGIPDFFVATSNSYNGECTGSVADERGFTDVFSGADGARLHRIEGPRLPEWADGCEFLDIDGGKDVNGDGIGDLIAGQHSANIHIGPGGYSVGGAVEVYSGRTGTMLWRVWPGWHRALVGDLDGDGLSEWAHGDRYSNEGGYDYGGAVTVYRGFPGDAERACTSLPNSSGQAAQLSFEGPISLTANQLHLVVEGAVPFEQARAFYGPELTQLPFGDGYLCVGGGTLGIKGIGSTFTLDADGAAIIPVDMTSKPLKPWAPGTTWTIQVAFTDPGGGAGFNLTDAMRVTLTP